MPLLLIDPCEKRLLHRQLLELSDLVSLRGKPLSVSYLPQCRHYVWDGSSLTGGQR